MSRWLLQWNPKTWDPGGRPITDWKVSRYLRELQPGDDVVLWRGGTEPGVYGIFRVTAPVVKVEEPRSPDEIALNIRYKLPIEKVRHLVITKADLIKDPHFACHDIVNNPRHRQPNPFRLTDAQWAAIDQRASR